jgi:chaperonin GroES
MNLKPLGNRAIISLIEEGNFSTQQSGIIIPDTVKGNLNQGKVMAIGDCKQSALNVGDLTIFSENTGVKVKIKNENYLIINEQDILAVVTDK